MYMVTVRLGSSPSATAEECTDFIRKILGTAGTPEFLVHVYAQPSAAGADLVLFIGANSVEAAEIAAEQVCRRALLCSRREFNLLTCGVTIPFAPYEPWLDPPLVAAERKVDLPCPHPDRQPPDSANP